MNRQKLYNCCICNHEYNEKQTCNFDINNYNQDSSVLRHILSENSTCDITGKISKKCHAKLNQHAKVTCSLCLKTIKYYMALVLPPSRDLPMDKEINKKLVCKPCNSILVDEIMCVACDHKCPKHKVIKYRASKYDMTDNIVQTTLCGAVNQLDIICIDCDRKLTATNTCTCCH